MKMKKSTIKKVAVATLVVVLLLIVTWLLLRPSVQLAVDAYIYGYPLVTFDTVRQQQTNVAAPDAALATKAIHQNRKGK